MYSGNTVDSRSGLPEKLDYEMIRFRTHTGRAFLINDRGFEKKYGYRHGVETPVGDIEENLWCELMKELIKKNGDTALYEQLLEWYRDIPVAGQTKKEREFYVLQCFSNKIFDNTGWVDYLAFNQKYRPGIFKDTETETTDDEKIDVAAREILERHRAAFEELAK